LPRLTGWRQLHKPFHRRQLLFAQRVLKNLLDDDIADIGVLPFCARDIFDDGRLIHGRRLPYGGGEHAQFYDPKTRTMLITYNCNSSSFEKLVSNLEIYSPKVLRISMDR